MASARAGNPSGAPSESARFDQLSSDQQILVWAGGASQYGSLDAFKSALAGYASANAAAAGSEAASATGKGASDQASDGSTTSSAADDAMAQAVKSLLDPNPTQTTADVALTLLKNGAAAQAVAKTNHDAADAKSNGPSADSPAPTANQNAVSPSDSPQPYRQGSAVSLVA
jgi:hypothetical protein